MSKTTTAFRSKFIFLFILSICQRNPLASGDDADKDETSNIHHFLYKQGAYFSEHIIETLQLPGGAVEECTLRCQNDDDCKSFNIRNNNTICDLNDAAAFTENDGSLTVDVGSQYYMKIPEDCSDFSRKDGVQWIAVKTMTGPIRVYCEDGWTVLMRRTSPELDFDRPWAEYRGGFGDVAGDHWLGLEAFHHLTNQGFYYLMTEVRDIVTNTYFSDIHNYFRIGAEEEKYALDLELGGTGNLSVNDVDKWERLLGANFTTFDHDNDERPEENCANNYRGGWWFRNCCAISLTARISPSTDCSRCVTFAKHSGIPGGGNGSHKVLINWAVMKIKRNDDMLLA